MSKSLEFDVVLTELQETEDGTECVALCVESGIMIQLHLTFCSERHELHVEVDHAFTSGEHDDHELHMRIATAAVRKMSKNLCLAWGEQEPSGGVFEPVTHFEGKRIH